MRGALQRAAAPSTGLGSPSPSAGRFPTERTFGLPGPVSDGNHHLAPTHAEKDGSFSRYSAPAVFSLSLSNFSRLFNTTGTSEALIGGCSVRYKSEEVKSQLCFSAGEEGKEPGARDGCSWGPGRECR